MIQVGPKSNDRTCKRGEEEDLKHMGKEVTVKLDTEIGVVQTQAKECQGPPETKR